MAVHTIPGQKCPVKACGQVCIADTVSGILGFKEMRTCIKFPAAQAIFRQIPEARRMVIVAVADDHRIQILQLHTQPVGIMKGIRPAAAIKKDPAAIMLYIERQAMLGNECLVLRGLIVHQGCDM